MKRHRAFTLIELLMVISIIALLIGIAIVGFARVGRSAQEKQTRGQLEVLMLMLSNYHDAAKTTLVYPDPTPVAAPQSVAEGGADRYGTPVITTATILGHLRTVPRNNQAYEQVGADKLLKDVSGNYLSVLLDAWGNPIIYVPKEGLNNVTLDGYTVRITSLGVIAPSGTPNPESRPFWASAGPDGDFRNGDDNIYSFEN